MENIPIISKVRGIPFGSSMKLCSAITVKIGVIVTNARETKRFVNSDNPTRISILFITGNIKPVLKSAPRNSAASGVGGGIGIKFKKPFVPKITNNSPKDNLVIVNSFDFMFAPFIF